MWYENCFAWAELAHIQGRKAGQDPFPASLPANDATCPCQAWAHTCASTSTPI